MHLCNCTLVQLRCGSGLLSSKGSFIWFLGGSCVHPQTAPNVFTLLKKKKYAQLFSCWGQTRVQQGKSGKVGNPPPCGVCGVGGWGWHRPHPKTCAPTPFRRKLSPGTLTVGGTTSLEGLCSKMTPKRTKNATSTFFWMKRPNLKGS